MFEDANTLFFSKPEFELLHFAGSLERSIYTSSTAPHCKITNAFIHESGEVKHGRTRP